MTKKQEAHARRMRKQNARTKIHLTPTPPKSNYYRKDLVRLREFERTPIERAPYPPLDQLLNWANAVKEKRQ